MSIFIFERGSTVRSVLWRSQRQIHEPDGRDIAAPISKDYQRNLGVTVMDKIQINGGVPLHGTITISGAKNAALPLMAASLLTDEPLILENVPDLADIRSLMDILGHLGVETQLNQGVMTLRAKNITTTETPYELVRKMRASIVVMGPLLARMGHAIVSMPGGCAIGTRPIDQHISGFEALGAQVELIEGNVHAKVFNQLRGTQHTFAIRSVGATENVMMAAVLAKGETVLANAAREPEVVDLANGLVAMGAKIDGIGTDVMTITGVDKLHGARYRVIPDRIETGTYAIAAAITNGKIILKNTDGNLLSGVLKLMGKAGIAITPTDDGFIVDAMGPVMGVDVVTEPFPGFPTDLQAQWMALMTTAHGAAMITETIFENRFMHVPELCRMGANITVHGGSALVRGVPSLTGAPVMATDLRASSSLVLAGLAATGETVINRIYHLDRGYERLEEKLGACGARIKRIHYA